MCYITQVKKVQTAVLCSCRRTGRGRARHVRRRRSRCNCVDSSHASASYHCSMRPQSKPALRHLHADVGQYCHSGGLLPQLQLQDFYTVTALLVIEALRYTTSLAMTQMLISPLYNMQGKPSKASSMGKDWHETVGRCIFCVALIIQVVCTFGGVALASWRLHNNLHARDAATIFNSNAALKVFYALAVSGNSIAIPLWFQQLMVKLLIRYLEAGVILTTFYHHVISVCLQQGLWAGMSENHQEYIVTWVAQELFRGVTRDTLRLRILKQWSMMDVLAEGDEGLDVLVMFLWASNRYQQQASIILLSEWPNMPAVLQAAGVIDKIQANLRCTSLGQASAQFFHASSVGPLA